jgi:ABC-2 type transport system permease protein
MTSIGTRSALINNGFDVVNISADGTDSIPGNLTALIIADPKSNYTSGFIEKLEQYLAKGGNLLIAGEPDKQSIINPIITKLGVTLSQGTLLQESKNFSLDLVQASFSKESSPFFPFPKDAIISMPGVVGLQYDTSFGYKVIPVLLTDKKSVWNKLGKFNLEADKITFDAEKDERLETPVALALSKKVMDKEQKIMVFGDADFMSNGELGRQNLRNKNAEFVLKIFKWFSNGEFPIDATRPDPIDNKIKVSKAGVGWMKMILLGVFPVCIALAGSFVVIRRKRK